MIEPWTPLKEKTIPAGTYRAVRDVTYALPDGREEIFTIHHIRCPVVAVLPITTAGEVVLARQFRPGPNRVLNELPGGGVEPGESHLQAAQRELLEETGYRAGRLESLGFPLECAYSDVRREAFLATGCEWAQKQDLDRNEFIETVTLSMAEFLQLLVSGACTDLEIGWMGLHRLGVLSYDMKSVTTPGARSDAAKVPKERP